MTSIEEVLNKLQDEGVTGQKQLLVEAKKRLNGNVTAQDVEAHLAKTDTPFDKPDAPTRRIIPARYGGREASMDLIDFARTNEDLGLNKVFTKGAASKYLLLVVDGLSRKLYYEDLQSKERDQVLKGLGKILDEGHKWDCIIADGEGAWSSNEGRAFLKERGIRLIVQQHAPQVEAMIRVLRTKTAHVMARRQKLKQNPTWREVFADVVTAYNKRDNATTGMPPNEAADAPMWGKTWQRAAQGEELRILRAYRRVGEPGPPEENPIREGDRVLVMLPSAQGPLSKRSKGVWDVTPRVVKQVDGGSYRVSGTRRLLRRDEIKRAKE